jgi:hypothetical protein
MGDRAGVTSRRPDKDARMNTQSPTPSRRFLKVAAVLCWVVAIGLVICAKGGSGMDFGLRMLIAVSSVGFALAGYMLLRRRTPQVK